ncbi:hypothetical protein MHYP_G00308530 [Metynnis hypsauchen]
MITHRKPDFEFLNADPLFGNLKETPFVWADHARKWLRSQKRGRRASLLWNVRFIESFCSPDLEYLIILCIVLWLPREISGVVVTDMYIPPQPDTDLVLGKLYEAVNSPEATTIVVGDFNKAKFRHLAPKFVQHI